MHRMLARPGLWLALLVLLPLAACEDKKGTPTQVVQAPTVSDLRVRQESGGVAGAPTRFALTLAFSDPDGDVSVMEVKRQDTGEVSSASLPDAGGKVLGLAEAVFEIVASAPGDIPMTAALVDGKQNRSEELPFVIGIQPPEEGPPSEDLRKQLRLRTLTPLRAHVRAR